MLEFIPSMPRHQNIRAQPRLGGDASGLHNFIEALICLEVRKQPESWQHLYL